jgi:hypothetical protein
VPVDFAGNDQVQVCLFGGNMDDLFVGSWILVNPKIQSISLDLPRLCAAPKKKLLPMESQFRSENDRFGKFPVPDMIGSIYFA